MRPTPLRRIAGLTPEGLPLARELVRSGLGRAFGPPPFDPAEGPGDPGLFGPGSATWRLVAEPAAIVGGVRGLLVQLLHPLAVAGVADHSAYRSDPLGRLRRTSAWVTTTAFAATPAALAAGRVVRRAHERVVGVAPDGRPYRADDPDLLVWVSIALTSSFLAADRAYAPQPLGPADADAFVAEQARAAALLDPRVDLDALARRPDPAGDIARGAVALPLLEEGRMPTDAAGLAATLDAFAGELGVDAQGRDVLEFLLWPPIGRLRAGYLPLLAGALATLAPAQRRLLGLPASRAAAAAVRGQTRLLLGGLRLSTGSSPVARSAAARAEAPAVAA